MRFLILIFLVLLIGSCKEKKAVVFRAFTDSFMDYYELNLYVDGKFVLHVPVIDYTGSYSMKGDTIFLNYDDRKQSNPPEVYLISADRKQIDELILTNGNYQESDKNRWIQITNIEFK